MPWMGRVECPIYGTGGGDITNQTGISYSTMPPRGNITWTSVLIKRPKKKEKEKRKYFAGERESEREREREILDAKKHCKLELN